MPDVQQQARAKIAELRKAADQLERLAGGRARPDEATRDIARKRDKRADGKNVYIPACEDLARRQRLEADDEAWLLYYYSRESGVNDPFWYLFTMQQKVMIGAIGNAVKFRGDQAIAASRGEGKTTIFERLVLKYTLQGLLSFSVLFAASGDLASNSLDAIKTSLEENPLLLADYPEVCVPVAALQGAPQRAHAMTVSGHRHDNNQPFDRIPCRFTWCGKEIILPKVPGSPSSRAIIATRGLDGAIRGIKKKGRRVDLAGIDDPDTEDTVRNEEQATLLEKRIDKGIAGLGDQQEGIARVMLTTIQNRKCVSWKFTDPGQKSSWKGKRFRYLIKPPTNREMWDEYIQIRQRELIAFAKGESTDEHCRQSHAFYLANREAMDLGAEVANSNRFNSKELPDGTTVEASALQHYFNEVARTSAEDVATELDNDPPEDETETRLILTAYHIQHGCPSGLEKREVPEGTVCITVGGDVKKLGTHYTAIAWNEHAVGCIIEYDFFEFMGTANKLAADAEIAILEGLHAWHEAQMAHPFTGPNGEELFADLTLIDTGWKEKSWSMQPVQAFCSQVGYSTFMPSRGASPYHPPRDTRHVVLGDNWHYSTPSGLPEVQMNSDHWKLKVHEGFLADDGQPGSLRLFTPPRTADGRANRTGHLSYSKHILAETWETRFTPGFKGGRTGWWKLPKPNHWFDSTYAAICARSVLGLNVLEAAMAGAGSFAVQSAPAASPATEHLDGSSGGGWSRERSW